MRKKLGQFLICIIIFAIAVAYNLAAWRIGYVGIIVKYGETLWGIVFLAVAVAIEAFCFLYLISGSDTDEEHGGMY